MPSYQSAPPMGHVKQLTNVEIDEMVDRQHDLDYQLWLVRRMHAHNEILPFPFQRAVVLLIEQERHIEALAICQYVERWCAKAEAYYDGISAMVWMSPKLQDCIDRIPGLNSKL